MPTDKPMPTKDDIEAMLLYEHDQERRLHLLLANTIERAVELLERCVNSINSLHRETDCEGECAATRPAKDATAFLAAYHGTGTEKGEQP